MMGEVTGLRGLPLARRIAKSRRGCYEEAMKMLDDALLQTATQRLVIEFQP